MKKRKVPVLRFKGFTKDWEQRKLGDIFISLQNNTLSRMELNVYNGVAYNVHYGDVLINFAECLDVSKEQIPFIKEQHIVDKLQAVYLHNGDIVVADTAEDETVGKCTEVMGIMGEKVLSGLHTIPLRPKVKFATGFWGFYLNSPSYRNQLVPLMQGIKVTSISKSAMKSTNIIFPNNITEQAHIGLYFLYLNHLITLHQRKLEKLKKFKKSMLEKMFPKNGEKIPEIRFFSFINDWEQRKLGELSNKVTEKNIFITENETFTNSAELGIISQKDFFEHDVAKKEKINNYYIVKPDDFIYNPRISTTAPVGPINRNKLGRNGVISPLYTIFHFCDIDCAYLEFFFKSNVWHDYMKYNGDTGARSDRFSIKDDVFFNMPISFPDSVEAKKIGKLLESISRNITLHQRKLEKLKKIKKSMLEKMFV